MKTQILTIQWILERFHVNNPEVTLLFENFSKAFDSIHRGKMEQILQANGLDYMFWTLIDLMKENGFTLEKARSRWYSTQTITDADYTDDIALLANTPAQAESLLHSQDKAAGGIGHHVKTENICFNQNADKTEYMYFNQNQNQSCSLKLVDKFTDLGNSIPSTENDINTWLANYRLCGSQTYPIKWNSFFQAAVMSILLYGYITWMLTKCREKKLESNCMRMLQVILNKS